MQLIDALEESNFTGAILEGPHVNYKAWLSEDRSKWCLAQYVDGEPITTYTPYTSIQAMLNGIDPTLTRDTNWKPDIEETEETTEDHSTMADNNPKNDTTSDGTHKYPLSDTLIWSVSMSAIFPGMLTFKNGDMTRTTEPFKDRVIVFQRDELRLFLDAMEKHLPFWKRLLQRADENAEDEIEESERQANISRLLANLTPYSPVDDPD